MQGREDETGPAGEENNGGNGGKSVPPIAPHALDSLCDALFNGSSEDAVATASFPAGETPDAAVPSVILEPAFTWCCPKCHGINFELPIVAELTEEQREEIQEEYGENPIGRWTVAPDTVGCKHCQCEFDAIDFELIDEDDEDDEDDEGLGEFYDDFDDDEDSFDNFLRDVDSQFDDGEDGESWKHFGGDPSDQGDGHGVDQERIDDANRELSEVAEGFAGGEEEWDGEINAELAAAAESNGRDSEESPDTHGPNHIENGGSIADRIVNGLEEYAKQLQEEDDASEKKPDASSPAGNPRSGKPGQVSLPKFETEWIIANPFGIGWIPGGM